MKNENPIQLSIIVPHYNIPDLLADLLNTIPDIPQIEVIVVDDHSNDKLEEFSQCQKKYGNRNVKFYKNDADKKWAGSARNIGMRYAVGEYLLFADADDRFLPDFWDSVKEAMLDGTELIYFAPTSKKLNNENSARHVNYEKLVNDYLKTPSHQNELNVRYFFYPPWSKLIKRSLVIEHKIKFDEVRFANDMMFSVQIGYWAKTIKASDKVIYCVYEREGSLITFGDKISLKKRDKAYCRYYFYLRKNLKWSDLKLLGYSWRDDYKHIKKLLFLFIYECLIWCDKEKRIKWRN